jgi:hypothetical protein
MSGRIAYFDCFSGVSGDMLLGALLDAGLGLQELTADLAGLGISGYELALTRQVRQGISGSRFSVLDLSGDRPARSLQAVEQILQQSTLSQAVVAKSLRVFRRLAEVEATVHGISVDEVHFHEVGAVDTLVDIVGFCCAAERLGLEAFYASPLPLGSGTVKTEHGLLPVPAPATLALLAAAKAPVIPSDARAELVTPTGAAILSTLASFCQPPMNIEKVGYGFGAKELPWANLLRVWIGEALGAQAVPHALDHEHLHEHPPEDVPAS